VIFIWGDAEISVKLRSPVITLEGKNVNKLVAPNLRSGAKPSSPPTHSQSPIPVSEVVGKSDYVRNRRIEYNL